MTTLSPAGNATSSAMALTPFRLGPPRLILGMEVTTFSYVFLAVGGVAPIIFIAAVVVVMKCYAWRKVAKYKKYAHRVRIHRDVWELERRQYFASQNGSPANGYNGAIYNGDSLKMELESGYHLTEHTNVDSPAHKAGITYSQHSPRLHAARVSSSNPNVYFLETPVLQLHRHKKPKVHMSPSPEHCRTNGFISNGGARVARVESVSDIDCSPIRRKLSSAGDKKLCRKSSVSPSKNRQHLNTQPNPVSEFDIEVDFELDGGRAHLESLPGLGDGSLKINQAYVAGNNENGEEVDSIGDSILKSLEADREGLNESPISQSINRTSRHSMTSDEAEALHCFDNIYLEPLGGGGELGLEDEPTPRQDLTVTVATEGDSPVRKGGYREGILRETRKYQYKGDLNSSSTNSTGDSGFHLPPLPPDTKPPPAPSNNVLDPSSAVAGSAQSILPHTWPPAGHSRTASYATSTDYEMTESDYHQPDCSRTSGASDYNHTVGTSDFKYVPPEDYSPDRNKRKAALCNGNMSKHNVPNGDVNDVSETVLNNDRLHENGHISNHMYSEPIKKMTSDDLRPATLEYGKKNGMSVGVGSPDMTPSPGELDRSDSEDRLIKQRSWLHHTYTNAGFTPDGISHH